MMINNYVPTHLHSTYSINDSTTDPEDYINKAKELGMKAIAFTEHGNAYNFIKKKQLCEKAGLKFIFGVEVYLTKSHEVKERDNYHTIMIAKNKDGIKEILKLLSISTNKEHQYYKNRLSFEEFCNSSRNIITTSACLGSPLANLDKSDEWFDKLMARYDYLEIQPHSEARQMKYNKYICELASEYNKPIISGTDTHEINEYKSECRKIILRSMQGDKYLDDMENFDLIFKSFDELVEMYRKQGVLDEETYMTAINNTNVLADIVEDFELDYTFKYPDIFKDPIPTMISRCYDRLNYLIDTNIIKDEDFMKYSDRIDSEVGVFDKLNMGSFMLYFGQLIGWCKDNDIEVGPGRGSVTGSLVAYLLGITEVDPIVWGTNFVRFCNVNRYSLGDIDCDFPPADRPRVYKYIREQFGDTNSAYIVTFQKLKVKSIIDSVGRALKMDVAETERIKAGYNDIEREEKSIHKQLENNRISEKEHEELMKEIDRKTYEYMSKFENIFYYFKGLNGAIASTGFHACFTGDTLVTTIDGYKAIKEICVGDMVLTHNNRFMPVLDVMHRKSDGDRINIKIRQDIIKTTKNHPFLCKKSQGEKAEWLPASEIDDMYVAKPLSYNSKELEWNGVHVKVNQFKTKKEHKLTHQIIFTEDFMRFCGRFIGDGWVQYHPKRAIVSICCSFDECDEVENILDKLMYGYRKDKKQTVIRYTINNRELTEFMKQFGRGAKNKCLPSWIFGLNIKLKKALFDGYISADGYIHKNRITWNSVSKKLILGMSLIAQEIYLNPVSIVKSRDDGSMSIQGRICNVSARYDASISTDVSRFSFVEDNNIWMKAEVIDSNFEDDDVYNLSVLTDNSYCVNDIIVHNCGIIGSPINVVETIGVRYNKDKDIFIAQCDMKNVDSVNYVKYDILSLKTMQVLRDTFRFAGLDYPDLDKINWKDEAVFKDMMTSPVGLFQMEADSAFQYLCKFNTSSVQDIALVNALIRPSCASFREQAIQKVLNKNPTEEIDMLLDDTYGYLIYQEQIILFLQKICGFTEAEADIIRRAIGKKSKALLDEWMPKIEEGYIKMSSKSEDEARKEFEIFSHILINASDYGLTLAHIKPL